jgi:RNA polymerase sigma-70 factor, ECF subfamily
MPGTVTRRFVSATDEGALVRAARSDPRAFADLYHRHVSAIYQFCHRRLGTKEAAEDATAQVFTKALGGLADYRGGSVRGWLFAIAYHVVVDEVRMARWDVPLTTAAASIDPGPGPEELAVKAEAGRTLRALLAQLPPEQRRVLELRLAGLSGIEIAIALGRSHGTIRNLQHRTLVRLRMLLGVTGLGGETDA